MEKIKNVKLGCLLMILAFFTVTNCEEDSLDVVNPSVFDESTVYLNADNVERLLLSNYNSTESWGLNKFIWWSRRFNIEGASFEAKFNFKDIDQYRLRAGWNAENVGVLRDKWRAYWGYVRASVEFLDKVGSSPAMAAEPERVEILEAEMKFLRANLYTKLLKYYGAVPIFEKPVGIDENFDIPRNTYEECVAFIVKDLDEAAAVLPLTRPDSEFGRATRLSALAVKSRTLLYAASKLHDPSTKPNGPFYDYTKATKWQDAADAAKAVVDLVGSRDLIATPDAKEYRKLFLSNNQDIFFARPYGELYDFGVDVNSLWDQTQSPSGYGGWALSSPTHNFALLFNMEDGTTTDGGTYDPANPNDSREMRYYADLNFQGSMYRDRLVDYALAVTPNETTPDGLDSPKGLGNTGHSSKTGYNIRKFLNEDLTEITDPTPGRPFILYRLAEVYLNYAEAQAELGNEASAREFLNKVSTRALQPAITASGGDLKEAIKRERRIELAFEGHNFFDERRWMNEAHLGFDIRGLRWTKETNGALTNEEYTVIARPWFARQYYLPIPLSEIEKTPALLQNDGY